MLGSIALLVYIYAMEHDSSDKKKKRTFGQKERERETGGWYNAVVLRVLRDSSSSKNVYHL